MKKIFVNKDEEAVAVIEKIITARDFEVTLVIPRGSVLRESISNFQLIRREASLAKKNIAIESVDEEVLAFAKASDIEAHHPLFREGEATSAITDIVPASRGVKKSMKKPKRAKEVPPQSEPALEEEIEETPEEIPIVIEKAESAAEETKKVSPLALHDMIRDRLDTREAPERRRIPRRLVLAGIAIVVIIVGLWGYMKVFGRVEVALTFKKSQWDYTGTFRVSKDISEVRAEDRLIPGEFFEQRKNTTERFDASGRDTVSEKARGTITIYNAFSSTPQPLVATTRFAAPDGKIFRLEKAVTVPGARVEGGTITPSSIDAAVVADKAGDAYNVGPVERLTIPGFQGTTKYQGFYGELKQQLSGGFIGEKPVPTREEIAAAKKRVEEILRAALTSDVLANLPEDFKILDDAGAVTIEKVSVNESTDAEGKFSVFGEGAFRALGFKESDLKAALQAYFPEVNRGDTFWDFETTYTNVAPDFKDGELSFGAAVTAVLGPVVDRAGLTSSILGKKAGEVERLMGGLEDLQTARVSFSPGWLRRVPKDQARVMITIE